MKKFAVRFKETGIQIDLFETLHEAKEKILLFEEEDKGNNEYEDDTYEIYDLQNLKIVS